MKRVGYYLLSGIIFCGSVSAQELTIAGGHAWVKIINPGIKLSDDDTLPIIDNVEINNSNGIFIIDYSNIYDVANEYWPYGTGIKKVRLWFKIGDGVWKPTNQELYNFSDKFLFDPSLFGLDQSVDINDYSFAVQAQDNANNRSDLTIPKMTKPRCWFFYPNAQGKMRIVLETPDQQDLSELIVPWVTLSNNETITKIGIGGPNGWGESSTDIFPFLEMPVVNMQTNFNQWGFFRGAPFIITNLGQLAYLNLGPPTNPLWDFKFGSNDDLIIDDGSGNSIIEFTPQSYVAPQPKIVFDYWRIGDGYDQEKNDPYVVLDAQTRYMSNLFWDIEDQSEIKQITVIHYNNSQPWITEEKPREFKDWPFYLDLTKYNHQMVGLTVAAIDKNGHYHYINPDAWQAFCGNKTIESQQGPWKFELPY